MRRPESKRRRRTYLQTDLEKQKMLYYEHPEVIAMNG
jgi:hypothetical protein